ncbi:MAG TPA: hypothetical protein VG897_00540 [Terriglobales bacterium]|nr:hypothetical protein [Terriglobales bacterium]
MSTSVDPSSLWSDAIRAIRTNLLPGVVLWLIATAAVLSYFFVDAARPVFETLGRWKAEGGFLFSIVATGVFAGLIPFLVLKAFPATRKTATLSAAVFMTLFWAYRGFEIDVIYRFNALMFGNVASLGTVAAKVAFDLFVYNVVWAASLQLGAYQWKNSGLGWKFLRTWPTRRHWTRDLPVALLSTWVVWLPVVTLTYSLPSDLQIPLFSLAACFWALVVATLTRPKAA